MRCPVLLILIVVEIVYLIAGGFIFWAIESPREQQHKQNQKAFNLSNIIDNFTASLQCPSGDELWILVNRVLEAERSDLVRVREPNDWDFHGSIFFATTVVTTIGYGNVTPSTAGGQIFCCFFAIIGIPFTMVMLLGIGDLLKDLAKKMEFKICCINRPRLNKVMNTVVIVMVGLGFFILIPAAIFMKIEGWHYGTAIYYGIVTTATVGFGDYVAAWNCVGELCWLYRISVGIWIFFGLAWLAGVIGSIQDGLEDLISKSEPSTKKTAPEEEAKPKQYGVLATEVRGSDVIGSTEMVGLDHVDSDIQYESVRL